MAPHDDRPNVGTLRVIADDLVLLAEAHTTPLRGGANTALPLVAICRTNPGIGDPHPPAGGQPSLT